VSGPIYVGSDPNDKSEYLCETCGKEFQCDFSEEPQFCPFCGQSVENK
jgi:DNA-directed RNA polymerase subunit RPC12/RpoP